MSLLHGKKGVIMGVANDHSIAWGISKKLSSEGAELCFTYQGEALRRRVEPLANSINSDFLIECDVLKDGSIKKSFSVIEKKYLCKKIISKTFMRFLILILIFQD